MTSRNQDGATARQMELVVDPWVQLRSVLESQAKQHPEFADVRNLLGQFYLETGEPEKALLEFESAVAKNPGYAVARFGRLVALRMKNGDLDPALWSEEALVDKVEEPQRSVWTSWYLAQRGDSVGAEKALAGLQDDPRWAGMAWFQTWLRRGADGSAGAQMALSRAAELQPLFGSIVKARGWLGRKANTSGFDIQTWNPASGFVWELLGDHCARLGAVDRAIENYENAFLRQGDESAHEIRAARLALATGDEESAVKSLRRAIELDPTSADARIALGFEYQSQGYTDEAVVQFEVAARLKPRYADIQYNLGLLYEATNRDQDAKRCYEQALEINPRYFQASTSLAQILLRTQQFEDALLALKPLERQGIRSADLLVQKAEAHMALGQLDAAQHELKRACDLNPSYPRTYYVMGQVYRAQGLKRKAQEAWKQHLERTRKWKESQPALEGEEWKP